MLAATQTNKIACNALVLSGNKAFFTSRYIRHGVSSAARLHTLKKRSSLKAVFIKAQQQEGALESTTGNQSDSEDRPPSGCARYSVTLRKPLGLVLEESKDKGIYVAEVLEGGNAARENMINVGDTLIATTGYTRTTEQTYGEIVVRGGEQVVRLPTRNESFDVVMAAISSHPAHVEVTLEFQRCDA